MRPKVSGGLLVYRCIKQMNEQQEAKTNKQGARSKEQRTRSREQGENSKEQEPTEGESP